MTIAICGSMQFHREMREVQARLKDMGHTALVPKSIELMDTQGYVHPTEDDARINAKIQHDFIREHFRKIEKSDVILILNYDKKGIPNYIGGNTFLEMGLAFWLGKKIYLLHPIPAMDYKTEMHAMQPTVLNGDLGGIEG
jgi:nucleoside 2-deoxyribosyltransferase